MRNHRVRNQPDPGAIHRYLEGQNIYFRECRPWELATMVIDNDDLAAPFVTDA
jgi:uridine kinase